MVKVSSDVKWPQSSGQREGVGGGGGCMATIKCWPFWHNGVNKLQTLVYDILPSTTAVFSYTIGSRKLSANKQFFVGAQTVGSLLQTTQIILDICFIIDHVAYTSSNKTKIIWIKMEFFFLPRVDALHVYMGAWVLGCVYSHISTWTFWRALTALVNSYTEIKSAPSVA